MRLLWVLQAVAIPLASIIFTMGFLPLKSHNLGYSSEQCCDQPKFRKVVLMVVDALKTGFVTMDHLNDWPFVYDAMKKGQGLIYNARVHPPTVTLPRVKALISGDIPGFVDVMMNFDSAELKSDNFLYQLNSSGYSSVFYGDDTWLKLFPSSFLRSEGTTSFFVSDYTEVDDNVTRHLDSELKSDDWTLMVLHYLGLDHIGHLIGPGSALVSPKLREMDGIVEKIMESFKHQNVEDYLLIVCGDHGMADQGGHGGVTPNEVSTPMIFLSGKSVFQQGVMEDIYQIDLLPTLSSLLNIPIARNSLGVAVTSLLSTLMTPSQLLQAVVTNCNQLMQLIHKNDTAAISEQSLARYQLLQSQYKSYKERTGEDNPERIHKLVSSYTELMTEIRNHHAASLVDYDVTAMICGFVMTVTALLVHFCTLVKPDYSLLTVFIVTSLLLSSAHITHCTSQSASAVLCVGYTGILANIVQAMMISVCITRLLQLKESLLDTLKAKVGLPEMIMVSFSLAHSLSLLASSFIEEEHQIAYFFSTTLVIGLFVASVNPHRWLTYGKSGTYKLLVALACLTLARKWNQTGDKWSHLSDIADWLNMPEHSFIKLALSTISIPVILYLTCRDRFFYKLLDWLTFSNILCVIAGVATMLFISQDMGYFSLSERGYYEANTVYICCIILFALVVLNIIMDGETVGNLRHLRKPWVMLTLLLHRTVNIPVMALTIVTEQCVSASESLLLITVYYWLGQASFFNQGNSNSLSTIDVSAGYKGMVGYNPAIQAVLMLCNTYAGPIFWMISLFHAIRGSLTSRNLHIGGAQNVMWFYLTMKLCDMSVLQFLIIIERYHLFVWTVFAPKLLYEVTILSIYLIFYTLATGLGQSWEKLDFTSLKHCRHMKDNKLMERNNPLS